MTRALDLLRERLRSCALSRRGFTFEDHGDAVGLSHEGVDTGLRATVRVVQVPMLDALRAEGRWVEASVPPSLLAEAASPVVLVVVDAAGHAVWATRDELLARLGAAQRSDATAESWQLRYSALAGVGGFGLHRMFMVLAAERLRPTLEARPGETLPGLVRTLTQLRRFIEDGEGFDVALSELDALGLPRWFVAAGSAPKDDDTVSFSTPPYFERLSVELRGARETLSVRDCTLRCSRGGIARSTWVNDLNPTAVGLTLRLDHAHTTLELRASLLGAAASAASLAGAARFVWRFGQGGRVTLLPGCAAAALPVGSVFAPQEREALPHGVVETLDALAAIERATGTAFDIDPAKLSDPAQAEGIRELLAIRSSSRLDRSALSMRLSLTGEEVRRLLEASGMQRRITFRMPPSRVSQTVLGVSVALGQRVQEVTGTLAQTPGELARVVGSLGPAERLDVELSAVEVREFYEPSPKAAPTTEPTAARGAPSDSRSGST